jgi:outer membrane protein assembly factor BamB
MFAIVGCRNKKNSEIVWQANMPVIGSQSSVRTADLNLDGVLDIVMGAGKNEYQYSTQGVLAFDGKTGNILWQQEAHDQVYGSATFYDVTGDNIPDVFIGGRGPHFKALNGKDGSVLWAFDTSLHKDHSILRFARYNFNNSVLIPDQNNNQAPELLTVNGGNSKAAPYSTEDRYPAVLMLLDAKNGEVIAADTMPDGRESYMSPVAFKSALGEHMIVFGSGGETIDGNLYIARLQDLVNRTLSNAKVIASEKGHGFIAPPSLVDLNGDQQLDIVAISHGSQAFAIDGVTHTPLWTNTIPNTECSNSFAVGQFTDDDTPDVFTFVSKGVWPNSTGSLQILLDGKDGKIAFIDSIGCTGFSSPVVYDLNDDDIDEAIISVNEFDCSLGYTGKPPANVVNRLIAIDFSTYEVRPIDEAQGFKNVFSTPWAGDLDGDSFLDIVHCQYYSRGDLMLFLGMTIKRIDTPVRIKRNLVWGSYMGSASNGTYTHQ